MVRRSRAYYGALLGLIWRETRMLWPIYLGMFHIVPLMGLFVIGAHNGTRLKFLAVRPENLPLFFTWSFSTHATMLMGFGALMVSFITIYGLQHEASDTSFHCLMERPVSPGMIYLLRCLEWGSPVVVCAILSMPITGLLILLGFTLYGSSGTAIAAWNQANVIMDMAVRGMAWMVVHSAWWTGASILSSFLISRWWLAMVIVYLGVNVLTVFIGQDAILWALPPSLLTLGAPTGHPDQFAFMAPGTMAIIGGLAAGCMLTGYLIFRRQEACS